MADRLFRTYNALIMACLRSYGRPQAKENFRRIIASLTELRDAWKFVEATAGKAAKAKTSEKTLESAAGR
jgi:flagellar protein FliS